MTACKKYTTLLLKALLQKYWLSLLLIMLFSPLQILGADVITNGTFDSDITTGWLNQSIGADGSTSWDNTIFGNASGSLRSYIFARNKSHSAVLSQSLGTINSTDDVSLSLYWYKSATVNDASTSEMFVLITKPSLIIDTIWFETSIALADNPTFGNVTSLDVSTFFDETGNYSLRLMGNVRSGRDSEVQVNFDDVVLDVAGLANSAPTIVSSATGVAPASVNRIGSNTTTISADFTDTDSPGVGAFNCTFKINDASEYTLVNNQSNGGGGLTISDNGGGDYTASYTYNPDDAAHATGTYDLYFEVSDGTDNAIDGYANNPNELTITQQYVPTIAGGATQVSPASVNRIGANTTTISADFSDLDQPAVTVFNCTFKINDASEYTLVNNLAHGAGGLTVINNGGGSYTASYVYNPDDASHATGTYDLYFEVSDGSDNAIDDYASNTNELTITQQTAPTIVASATEVSPASVNRIGANTTTISADFTDVDQPAVGTFTCTFKINDVSEYTLVNNLTHGAGGLTVINNGGGSYTASYVYNPDDAAHATGDYDLYFEVSDGTDNAIDSYANNPNELNINELNAPSVVASATQVSPASVNRIGANTTTISADFTDIDQPAVSAFTCTFKIQDISEYVLVNNQSDGGGGLSIINNGGGSYTASYVYNPDDALHAIGTYDLYFEVSDGTGSGNTIDSYANNTNELTITQQTAPTITASATQVAPASVNRIGSNTTTISADFTDVDQPVVGTFTCTFKINDASEYTLVNNLAHGAGGLTVINNGGGSYTASYVYNPDDALHAIGDYDLYFEVSDGTDNAIDGYASNPNELTIIQLNSPTIVAGATQVSLASVNRIGANTTTISADFTDIDQPAVGVFNCSFKINDASELILVNNLGHGAGGLTIINNGGGSYTANYTFNPNDATHDVGTYDLYFEVSDGSGSSIDDYTNNANELTIFQQNAPTVVAEATTASPATVNRQAAFTSTISTDFTDLDEPSVSSFTVTFKVKDVSESEYTLVNGLTHGNGGLTITDNTGGSYTASYSWDPGVGQAIGDYDLYFEVSDGTDNVTDGYIPNANELNIFDTPVNAPPVIIADNTIASPNSVDRQGVFPTTITTSFSDADIPGVGEFTVSFRVRYPNNITILTLAEKLANGVGGMTITDDGGGDYTASISWDPPDVQELGYYDLQCTVYDSEDSAKDDYDINDSELLLSGGGESEPPIVPGDATYASPAGVERIGANTTTISATFTDVDAPAVSVFMVTFKLREPDDIAEITLASNVPDGSGGVTISNLGGGVYEAAIDWDPSDAQTLGFYDLYFSVTEGGPTSIDEYGYNENELQVYDAISNNAPTITAGITSVLPVSINRIGSEFTMIKSTFTDVDMPGVGAFTITIKVRDESNTEYTIVNAAQHGLQGLRITHEGSGIYETAVLWDPPDAQTTGTYDLYFYVEDNASAPATDNYSPSNLEELTLTSSPIMGDGNQLRRTNNSDICGGPASACHNVSDHQSQGCLACHTSHGTKNIYMIRETITTPSSGDKTVLFKSLGAPDAYNTVPSETDDAGGSMASDANNVQTEICEVCHTSTSYYRNDDSHTSRDHHNVENCVTACHPHADGFAGSGGEPNGGDGCACHASIVSPMQTTSGYHHMILSTDANYDTAQRTCLMCHVHHDIFSPVNNPGFGSRASNLRVDVSTSVVQGSGSVSLNSDYQSAGSGGICLSCHSSTQTKSYAQPDGTTETPALSKSDYDAATTAHNYNVASSTWGDGSSFNANCIKCHDDDMTNSYGDYGTHDGSYRRILNPMGLASPSDPLEEDHCLSCHSSGDYYGVKSMSAASTAIDEAMSRTYGHPTTTYSGRHKPGETASDLADGNRHAECVDCHNPHAARQGTHDGSSNLVSNALIGVWGVEPTGYPSTFSFTDNANKFYGPTGYTKMEPATKEYQICLKCHSNYTTLPSGSRNIAEEMNPNYPSTHGLFAPSDNPFINSTTMLEPWATSKINYCSDCHRSDISTDPEGPHGSNQEHLLVATIVSSDATGTPLCAVCHLESVYWTGSGSPSDFDDHPGTQGQHVLAPGCFSCHMWDHSSTAGLGLPTADWPGGFGGSGANSPPIKIWIHGQNRKWVYNEQDGSNSPTGDPVENFMSGYIADMDHSANRCWTETCKVHSNKAY